jgi:putative membrane protein
MTTRVLAFAAAALAATVPALAQGPDSTSQTPSKAAQTSQSSVAVGTQSFLKSTAEGGHSEVDVANLALSKTSNAQVKQLAETIKSDHEKANVELQALGTRKQVTLPTMASKTQKANADRLAKLSGAEFDKAYVSAMVKDHHADIKEFENHRQDADPDVAAWVNKTLPTLENHLNLAEAAQKAIGGGH